jgi:N-acyl-phosphatidylethanolamine-hydrolysing phospholipase D
MALPPRHHTARGFRNNYIESATRSLREVLRWQRERRRGKLPPPPTLPIPRESADLRFLGENALRGANMQRSVTWIGHATALVQAGGLNVLTDPIFSARASPVQFAGPRRAFAPAIDLAALPHIDVVLISHNHYDHLDRRSVTALARQAGGPPLFVVPIGLKAWLAGLGIDSAVELDWWQWHTHAGNGLGAVEFHLTPAQHWSGRSLTDRNQTLWGAFAVLAPDLHWYFSGDTGYSADFSDTRRHFAARQDAATGGGFDVALIAVGACLPRWFMQPQHVDVAEAVQVHVDLGAKLSIGVHWGTFELADDPLDHPLHELGAALAAKNVAVEAFVLLPMGATRVFAARH